MNNNDLKAISIRKAIYLAALFMLAAVCLSLFASFADAYWVWTPETKKFINPKYAVKDSPKEQFDWAMSFFDAKDYQRAAIEFEKLTKQYEYSEYASKAQYRVGLSYEKMGKFYTAFLNYQKAIDNYPHIDNIDEIIDKELAIGDIYLTKTGPKIMGTDVMTSADRAIEIYKKVVENAPFGRVADSAQFKSGQALKKMESYEEAIEAFQKVVDNYPASEFCDKARYEVADCANKASLKPAYASEPTERAIKIFEEFSETNKDNVLTKEADTTIRRLKNKAAEKSFSTAKFYESQKHYDSAIIYYQDVLDKYPGSSFADASRMKIGELKDRMTGKKITEAAKKSLFKFGGGKKESAAPKKVAPPKAKKIKKKVVVKKEKKVAPKAGAKVEEKAAPVAEAKVEEKAAPVAETNVEEKIESKPEAKVEAKIEPKAEIVAGEKPEVKTETTSEAKPEAPQAATATTTSNTEAGQVKEEAKVVGAATEVPVTTKEVPQEIGVIVRNNRSRGWVPFKFTKKVTAQSQEVKD